MVVWLIYGSEKQVTVGKLLLMARKVYINLGNDDDQVEVSVKCRSV